MSALYLIAEGQTDILILEKLLAPEVVSNTELVAAGGSYGAQSLATTLLTLRRRPLALVVDADTTHETTIQERVDLLRFLLRRAAGNVPHEVFVAVPEGEIVFLQDRALFERLMQRPLSDLEWHLAKLSPKETISNIAGPSVGADYLLSQLTEKELALLRHHELIKGVNDFLSTHLSWNQYPMAEHNRTQALALAETSAYYQFDEETEQ